MTDKTVKENKKDATSRTSNCFPCARIFMYLENCIQEIYDSLNLVSYQQKLETSFSLALILLTQTSAQKSLYESELSTDFLNICNADKI